MNRTIRRSAPSVLVQSDPQGDQAAVEVNVLTPMLGGGPVAGQFDRTQPFSVKAVRGQLRRWWRASYQRSIEFESAGDGVAMMAMREMEVFGNVDVPSPFDLGVDGIVLNGVRRFDPRSKKFYGFGDRQSPQCYALFSALQNEIPEILAEGAKFKVSTRWLGARRLERRARRISKLRKDQEQPLEPWSLQDLQREFHAGLRLWLTFGGIGGRTRRGVGAVGSAAPEYAIGELADLRQLAGPSVGLWVKPAADAMQAWETALAVYQRFRQTGCRRRGGNRPGRTQWPEPDSIRKLTGCALRQQDHDHTEPMDPRADHPLFPRATLGLPIIFKFAPRQGQEARKDGRLNRNLDPAPSSVQPLTSSSDGTTAVAERMNSPVLTRPVRIGDQWHALVGIFRAGELDGLRLQFSGVGVKGSACADTKEIQLDANVTAGEKIEAMSIGPAAGKADALEALAAFVSEGKNGFQEVP